MPLSDIEKQARRDRAKRRKEAKAKGTYVPRSERKAKAKSELRSRIVAESGHRLRPSAPLKRRRTWDNSSGTEEPKFRVGEPVLVKGIVTGIVASEERGEPTARYHVRPVENPKSWDVMRSEWIVRETEVSRWPRKSKKGGKVRSKRV